MRDKIRNDTQRLKKIGELVVVSGFVARLKFIVS